MALLPWVWYGGGKGEIKALLRSGPFPYEFWVGGDRAVPFGPLPVLSTTAVDVFPRSIVSTGPGPDDWVVCYANSGGVGNNDGVNVAFATVDGIVKTREIPQQSPSGFMVTHSAGNFATHRTDRLGNPSSGTGRIYYWNTPDAQESAPITGQAIEGQTIGFALPDVFGGLLSANSLTNLWQVVIHDPDFSYAFHQRDNGTQQLFSAGGGAVEITPSIPLTSSDLQSTHFSLSGLILYRHLPVLFGTGNQPDDGTININTDRWQLYPDGTWEALDPISLGYISSTAFTRLGASYHP